MLPRMSGRLVPRAGNIPLLWRQSGTTCAAAPSRGNGSAVRSFSAAATVLIVLAVLGACARGGQTVRTDSATGSVARSTGSVLTLRLIDVSDSRIGGLAVLLADSAATGTRYVLVDGGEHPREVLHALRALGVDTLALVVLTHAHADHYGGLTAVLRALPTRAFAFNGDARTLASYRRLLAAVEDSHARVIVVDTATRSVTVAPAGAGDTARLTLLRPPATPGDRGDPENNRSVGVLVHFGGFSALVPGDAERDELRWWMRQYGRMLDVDVLVSGHHGSANANATERWSDWYRIVTPRALLISANGRQHPFAEVIDYARAQGIPVYCTHTSGAIRVRATPDGRWAVTTERPAACTAGSQRPRP